MGKAPIWKVVLVFAVALLSIAAGIPKILQMPQELGFLAALKMNPMAVSVLGVVQAAGGLLMMARKTRWLGAILAGLALLISTIAIFVGGQLVFGLVSLIPIALILLILSWGRSQ